MDVQHLSALAIHNLVVVAVFLEFPLLGLGAVVLGQDSPRFRIVRVARHGQHFAGVRVNQFDVLAAVVDLDHTPELSLGLVVSRALDERSHDASLGQSNCRCHGLKHGSNCRCHGLKHDASGRTCHASDLGSAWPRRWRVAIDNSSRYAMN